MNNSGVANPFRIISTIRVPLRSERGERDPRKSTVGADSSARVRREVARDAASSKGRRAAARGPRRVVGSRIARATVSVGRLLHRVFAHSFEIGKPASRPHRVAWAARATVFDINRRHSSYFRQTSVSIRRCGVNVGLARPNCSSI